MPKSLQERSRDNWNDHDWEDLSFEQINLGAQLRIADALEGILGLMQEEAGIRGELVTLNYRLEELEEKLK